MSSRTVKWLLLASVLLVAFPVVAGASTARVDGMGIQGDYIKDYTNIYTYLSNISCVGNVVYGELGNWNSDSRTEDKGVGAVIGNLFDGRFGAIGIHLREETAQLGQGDANTPPGAGFGNWTNEGSGTDGWDPNSNTQHAFEVMWGKKFGAMSVGLQMNRSYARIEGDPTIWGSGTGWNDIQGDAPYNVYYGWPEDLTWNRNILGFGGGFGYELSPKLSIETSILFQRRTFMAKDTLYDQSAFVGNYNEEGGLTASGQKWENDGSSAYLMAARGLWQAQPNLLVVPVFKLYSMKADVAAEFWLPDSFTSVDHPVPGAVKFGYTPIEDHHRGWQVGLAGNWTVNEKDLFVLGATVAGNKITERYRDAYVTFGTPDELGNADITYTELPSVSEEHKFTETMKPMIFAALETHVNSWLTLRLGAQQGVFYTAKQESEDFDFVWNNTTRAFDAVSNGKHVTTTHSSPFSMMVGAGFKFGNLQVDATVNPDFVHNGPYFISGQTTGEDAYDYDGSSLFPKVTATYTF